MSEVEDDSGYNVKYEIDTIKILTVKILQNYENLYDKGYEQ